MPGTGCEVDAGAVLGEPGGGRRPRVDDDQPAARARPGQVLDEGRHRRGEVGADEEHGVRTPEVGQREGQAAVDAEGAVGPGGGRGHAEPAVVVDVRRAQHDPGELAQRVGLLVRQPAAAEHRDGVVAVLRLDRGQARVHEVERLVPGGRLQRPASPARTRPPHQRRREAVGRGEDRCRGPALLAQAAAVRREVARADLDGRHGIRDDARRVCAHWSAQYGQWVGTGVIAAVTPSTSRRRGARRRPR